MKVVQFTIPISKEHTVFIQEDKLPHFYEHLHRHIEVQITLIIKGKGTVIAGNYMKPFCPGDIYIFGSNQPHILKSDPSYFDQKVKGAVHAISLFFNPKGTFKSFLALPEVKSINRFIRETHYGLELENDKQKIIIQEKILSLIHEKGGYLISKFIDLLQSIADNKAWKKLSSVSFNDSYTEQEGLRMNDVYQYILNHYTENVTLDKIATIACMTPQAFCRYFKKHTRKTYVNFLNEIRINAACKKIISRDFDSILNVAYENGFSNAVSFNRVFKRVTSKSPRAYMKEYYEKA